MQARRVEARHDVRQVGICCTPRPSASLTRNKTGNQRYGENCLVCLPLTRRIASIANGEHDFREEYLQLNMLHERFRMCLGV